MCPFVSSRCHCSLIGKDGRHCSVAIRMWRAAGFSEVHLYFLSELFDLCLILYFVYWYIWQVDADKTLVCWNFLWKISVHIIKWLRSLTLSLPSWLYHSHPLFIPSPSLSYTPPYTMSSILLSLAQCDSAQQLTHYSMICTLYACARVRFFHNWGRNILFQAFSETWVQIKDMTL